MKVKLLETAGSDHSIVNTARVSFAKESTLEGSSLHGWWLSEKDKRLLNYLANHKHHSPFQHSYLSFRISAPIFVARQLAKHQVGGSWNEVSGRYVDFEFKPWAPQEWRLAAANVKQGSSEDVVTDEWALRRCRDYYERAALFSCLGASTGPGPTWRGPCKTHTNHAATP